MRIFNFVEVEIGSDQDGELKAKPIRMLAAASVLIFTSTVVATASAEPASNGGCPAGFELLPAAVYAALGYRIALEVDEDGNNDGFACGRPLGGGLFHQYPAQIYHWRDNDVGNQ